jgi:hypothetical protein
MFGGSKEQATGSAEQVTGNAEQATGSAEGADFLNSFTGVGTGDIDQRAMSISYLQILQDRSDAVKAKIADPGYFFNTGVQQALGTAVEVIPVAYSLVWDERDKGGKTVKRWNPNTPELVIRKEPVPQGSRGFPKMYNTATGNEVVETYAYALVIKDHPEMGFLMHTAGLGSMGMYRRWNTMLKQLRLPNGTPAPIFAKSWVLHADVKMSTTTNQPFYAMSAVTEGAWLSDRNFFEQAVLPARNFAAPLLIEATADAMTMTVDAEEV